MHVDFNYANFDDYMKLKTELDRLQSLQEDVDTVDMDREDDIDRIKNELKIYEHNLSLFFKNMSKNNWFRFARKFNISAKEKTQIDTEFEEIV